MILLITIFNRLVVILASLTSPKAAASQCLLCVDPTAGSIVHARLINLPRNLPSAGCRLVSPAGGLGAFVTAPGGVVLTALSSVAQEDQALQCADRERFAASAPAGPGHAVLLSSLYGVVDLVQLELTPGPAVSSAAVASGQKSAAERRLEHFKSELNYRLGVDLRPGVETTMGDGEFDGLPMQPDAQLDRACLEVAQEIVAPREITLPVADIRLWLLQHVDHLNRMVFSMNLPLSNDTCAKLVTHVEQLHATLTLWQYVHPILSCVIGKEKILIG